MKGNIAMSKNKTLSAAKSAKNDEFYTQYANIQKVRTLVSVAVLIAFCAITPLVADDRSRDEHDVRSFLSNVATSFESRDAEAIKMMVTDKDLLERLREQMRYDRRSLRGEVRSAGERAASYDFV